MQYLSTALKSFISSALVLTLVLSSVYVYQSVHAEGEESTTSSTAGGANIDDYLENNSRYNQSCYPAVVFEQQHLERNDYFVDIDFSPAREEIEFLAAMGIIEGTNRNVFSPNKSLSRAEYLKMVFLAFGHEVDEGEWNGQYNDLNSSHWAADLIATATELDIVNGYQDGGFKADQQITYAEAIKMAARSANCDFFEDELARYGVLSQTYSADWFKGYMDFAQAYGIYSPSSGDASYKMVRWNGAMLTYNIMEYVNETLGISMRVISEDQY